MAIVTTSQYSKKEEFYNALTHGIGAFLAIPGLILLLNKSTSLTATVSYTIFGIAMFILYLSSTLYHSVPVGKSFLKKMDHCSIFLLIAGTYTPIALIAIGGTTGWVIVGIEWGLAFIGIILKQFFVYCFYKLDAFACFFYVIPRLCENDDISLKTVSFHKAQRNRIRNSAVKEFPSVNFNYT